VPRLRYFATGALFLLALFGAAVATLLATQLEPRPDPWIVGQLAFAMISIYLLVSQWTVARPSRAMWFLILPIMAFGFAFSNGHGAPESLFVPWKWLALAGLGWLWLTIVIARQGESHRWLAARDRWAAMRAGGPDPGSQADRLWQLPFMTSDPSSFATAAGTLMRGNGDRWRNRLNGALTIVLLAPAAMSAAAMLMAMLGDDDEKGEFGMVFVSTSLLVVCILPKVVFGEWPARLRTLWLRVPGDRPALWRQIERTLLQDIALIAAIHVPVAVAFLVSLNAPRYVLLLLPAVAALGALTSGYAGFLARISDWSFVEQGALYFVVIVVSMFCGVALFNSGQPLAVFWLLPLILALALTFRTMARSRFERMDWCQVRMKRFPRQLA
jgi:hypothetical protein